MGFLCPSHFDKSRRMPLDHAEEKSEPASDRGLSARDSAQCVVCGHNDHVEGRT